MLFPTLDFALFFFVVFGLAWALLDRAAPRKAMLLAASYFFYGYWDWRFCFLLATASVTAYLAGLFIASARSDLQRRWIIAGALTILLGILGFFKYYNFFLDSLGQLLAALGIERDLPLMVVVLPVGISFFTFQAISYILDVYRGDVAVRRSLVDLLLYISFFPQLVAGPIVRAADFLPQLDIRPVLTRAAVTFGLAMILVGLVKKMIIANWLATNFVDDVFLTPDIYDSAALLLAAYGYAIQIYCDFSGYSDIAIGTAALLGFHFHVNFRQPYRAASLQDFWRRWHISLSQWLRDYLYKPLGGSRHGRLNTYRNLLITMFLGGLWHGAAFTFVIWGMLHGVGLALERMVRGVWTRGRSGTTAVVAGGTGIWRVLAVIATFHFVTVGWIFFRSQDLDTALVYFSGLAAFTGSLAEITPFRLALVLIPFAFHFTPEDLTQRISRRLERVPAFVLAVLFALGLLIIEWTAVPGTAPFIYFQF